jgi:hypothetical protein
MADAHLHYPHTSEAEALLVKLDDSNTVSSLKNEQAAALIRRMLTTGIIAEGYILALEAQIQEQGKRIADTKAYLEKRSWSNGVVPRALELLTGEEAERPHV